uniref:single-strand selective monofunctional uracil DNA glycosylase isoform X1 n=2 Tax=Myxine glutinosa TaxID=7769 RepID=UPI00358F53FA
MADTVSKSSEHLCAEDSQETEPAHRGISSDYYCSSPCIEPSAFALDFLHMEDELNAALCQLCFSQPVCYVYNPTEYAANTHRLFVTTYCRGPKSILFLGMNPGPFGMAQNGVPFGEVSHVREWLRIEGTVGRPKHEHPKRPILGLACAKREISGARFWAFFRGLCGDPAVFFRHCYVHNYCPLAFLAASGKNITPPQLPANQRAGLTAACDQALVQAVRLLGTRLLIGVGRYAEQRARAVLEAVGLNSGVRVAFLQHPSPVNPTANRGWENIAHTLINDLQLLPYLTDKG